MIIQKPNSVLIAQSVQHFATCVWRNRSLKVLGWILVRDTTPLFNLSEYIDPGNRLPWPSNDPTACEVWGSLPVPAGSWTDYNKWVLFFFFFSKFYSWKIKWVIRLPGRVLCSHVTPNWPPRGRWVMFVTWHASSARSAVIWGFTMDSTVSVKVGSGEQRWQSVNELLAIGQVTGQHLGLDLRYWCDPVVTYV